MEDSRLRKFVTYLTKYDGGLMPPLYIGSTTEKKARSGKYFGSVSSRKYAKIFREELRNNPQNFSIEILTIHDTHEGAIEEELRLHQLHDVVKSESYINESLASPKGMFGRDVNGRLNPFFQKQHTEEFKKAQSERMTGRPSRMKGKRLSEEAKRKISEGKKGKPAWNSGKKVTYSEVGLQRIREAQFNRRKRENETPKEL